jgi:hypothetical protein
MTLTQYLQLDGVDEKNEKKETNCQKKIKKILRAISTGQYNTKLFHDKGDS